MPRTTDVAIVGGGAIGCSIAFYLSKKGIGATVFDRDGFASGASGATLGIIAPLWHLDPAKEALSALGMRSLKMFPGLADELRDEGIDPEFRQTGVLQLALNPEEVDTLRKDLAWQNERGLDVSWLDARDVVEREPEVNPGVEGGVYSPHEGYVRGQRYVDALVHAASSRGATLLEGVEVIGLEFDGKRVAGVRTEAGTYHAGHTVLAAGPWTGIEGRWVPGILPVRPVKGQRILLRKTGFMPKCPIQNLSGGYVVPQVDGNILVGATREDGEFDQRTTANGITQMFAIAAASFPTLKDATFVGARAGVRPGSAEDTPMIGPVPGWEGLSVASRHGHVGIMLSPGTGELMADYISSGDPTPLEPFGVDTTGR